MKNESSKIRFFQRFRWKLTLSYMAASLSAAVLIVLVANLLVVALFYKTDVWRLVITMETINLTPQIRDQIRDKNRGGEITTWLLNLRSGLENPSIPHNTGYSFAFEKSTIDVRLIVADKDGSIIASTPERFRGGSIRDLLEPAHQSSYEAALSGNTDPERLATSGDGGLVTAIVPVKSDKGEVIGIMMAQIRKPFSFFELLDNTSGSLVSALIFTGLAATLFGAVFGFLIARRITGRIENISAVTSNWEEGSFAKKIVDHGKDELSLLARKLNHMANELKQLLVVKQDLATLEERNRLAMDLHDTVKQQIFAANMQLSAAVEVFEEDSEAARKRVAEAQRLVHDVQSESSLMIKELRPLAGSDKGLSVAVDEKVREWNRQNPVDLTTEIENLDETDPRTRHELICILQESLSNIARHSGASEATIKLSQDGAGKGTLVISDNGDGFDTQRKHGGSGLQNIKERSESLHEGSFELSSDGKSGTRVEISWELNGGKNNGIAG